MEALTDDSVTQPTDSYWTIRNAISREAEVGACPPPDVCPQCQGLGWVKNPEPTHTEFGFYPFGLLVRCPVCGKGARRDYLLRYCGLEGKLLNVRLKDWKQGRWPDGQFIKQREEAFDAMGWFIQKRVGVLTFYGDFGAGKTMALAIICNELREQMVETYYTPLAHLLDHLRGLIASKEDTSSFWDRVMNVPVLAIDEVTRFYATEWAKERLFALVDTRYRRRDSHLTLFATNDDPRVDLPPEEALGYLLSRMKEGDMIELRGDMRPAAAQPKQWKGNDLS